MRLNSFKLSLILALGVVAVSVPAQETNSTSNSADELKNKSDLLKDDSQPQLDAGNYTAPHRLFNDRTPNLPPPRPLFLGNQSAAAQEAANRKKNWALLTPEQIYGLQTPNEILGLKKDDNDKSLSLEEQFLLRESQPAANAATNDGAGGASWRDAANLFDKHQDDRPAFSRSIFFQPNNHLDDQPDDPAQEDSTRYFKQFLNAKSEKNPLKTESKQATAWSSVFSQPAQPKQTPAQLADMERFRVMLAPAPSTSSDKTPAVKTSVFSAAEPETDSIFQSQPMFNPAGSSVAVIKDDLTRPVGIKPLPSIGAPENLTPATRPAWQAQLPPWLRDGPQAHDAN